MNLSMSMIESRLLAGDKGVDISDNSRSIKGVRFLSEGQKERSQEYVYIGKASEFFDDPHYADALVLSSGRNSIVCKGPSYEDLLNEVIGAFDFFNDVEMRLLSLAAKHASLSDMLAVVGTATEDSFLVFGIDGSVLGKINEERLPQSNVFLEVMGREKLQASVIGGYFKDSSGTVLHDLSNVPQTSGGTDGSFAVCMYLYQEDEAVGFVMCFPQQRNKTNLAESLESVIAPYLVQSAEFVSSTSPNQSKQRALEGLLLGARASEIVEARIMSLLGSPNFLKVITIGCLGVQNRTQRMLLMNEVEEWDILCMSCEVGNNVVFLVSSDLSEKLIRRIETCYDKKSLIMGVSMDAFGLENVQSAYRQALFVLEESEEAGVRYCEDLALPFLLETIRKEPAAQNLLHPAVGILKTYDAQNKTELFPTLCAYMAVRCNQSLAAKKLFVHINTLKYRLKRIVELTGINFEDQDALLYLELSLYLSS